MVYNLICDWVNHVVYMPCLVLALPARSEELNKAKQRPLGYNVRGCILVVFYYKSFGNGRENLTWQRDIIG